MVTRDTRWPAGTPCWVDLSAADVPKAAAFYQALFGWDITSREPESSGYRLCRSGGRIVAGLGPKTSPDEIPPGWTTYLAAEDADGAAARIKAAGGRVVLGPLVADDHDAVFSLITAPSRR